jgi:Ca2+-binding RTX toxin-like protein
MHPSSRRTHKRTQIAGEVLEVRTLLSTFFVNSNVDTFDVNLGNSIAIDSSGKTSLRAAIQEANALPGHDIIVVPSGTFTISRAGSNDDAAIFGDLDITSEITIRGAGSSLTFLDGADLDRVIDVTTTGSLHLSGVTVRNGTAANAGGIKNSGQLTIIDSIIENNVATGATNSVGGGIGNSFGTLTLDGVTLRGNTATINGGGIYNNSGNITIIDSTIENNSAAGDGGGLSIFRGSLTFTNGTISNNTAGIDGGGLSVDAATANLTNVTINNNTSTDDGGGVNSIGGANVFIELSTISANVAGSFGGGIRNFNAVLGLTTTTVSANSAGKSGGGFQNDRGISEIAGSLFQGNTAGENGGGLNTFTATTGITNSTFSGNQSVVNGGGINNGALSVATIINSTIVANSAGSAGRGGGARNFGTLNVVNTIFSDNRGVASGREVFGVFNSLGNNLIREIGGAAGFFNGTNGDLIGNFANAFEPFLSPLQDNGGATLTHALLADSPAIDTGNSNGVGQIDQTGANRIQDGNGDLSFAVDIGAVEYVAPLTTFIVNTTNDTIDINIGDGTAADADGNVSLRAAILEANALAGTQVIQVPAGTLQLTLAGFDDFGFVGDLDITDDLIIESTGGPVIVDAGGLDRVFHVNSATVSIDGVSMRNGSTTFAGGLYSFDSTITLANLSIDSNTATGDVISHGGGILIEQGTATLENVTVSNNSTDLDGAGIYAITATLNVTNSTISNNAAMLNGGGIALIASTSTIDSTTVSSNTSQLDGAGIAIASNSVVNIIGSTIDSNSSNRYGGGLHNNSSTLSVTETTVKNNSAAISGAGINNELGTLSVLNSSIYQNSATVDGGGIDNFQGIAAVTGSTISGNSAGQNGAGIVNFASGTVRLINTTITQNNATIFGGGIWNAGVTQLGNTIIAQNVGTNGAPDVSGTLTSLGTNLLGNNIGTSGIVNGVGGDIVGTSFFPIDAMLSSLGDYGGSTLSHLPLVGSPVIEAGTDVVQGEIFDQRGQARVGDSDFNGIARTDIGAVEYSGLTLTGGPTGLNLSFSRIGDSIQITDNSIGAVIFAGKHSEFDQFQLLGSTQDDSVLIDLSGGYALPVGGIDIIGEGASDTDTITLTAGSVGISAHLLNDLVDGSITIDGRAITYTSIEIRRDWSTADEKSFEFSNTTSNVVVSDIGSNVDGLFQISRSNGATVEFSGPVNTLGITTQSGPDVITVASLEDSSDFGVSIFSNDGNDTIDIRLISGDSTIDAGFGADTVQSGSGDDFILGSMGNDQIFANDGDDIVLGGGGPDFLDGGNGDDSLNGQGSSGDSLTGGLGDDLLVGGSGIDILIETADVDLSLTANSMTGIGTDTILQIERAILSGGDGNTRIVVDNSFLGDVTLDGGFGDDTLVAGSGNDVVVDSGGNDSIDGGPGNDTLLGGSGRDSIAGGLGDDFLFGLGGSGDRLTGGPGLDYIDGGAGSDKLYESTTAYASVVATNLTLTLTDSKLTGLGDDTLIGIESATLLGGSGDDILDATDFSGFVYLIGMDGNDQLSGGLFGDLIDGGNGDDVLQGNGGNDSIFGLAGDDTLKGSFGDDVLDGGAGDDAIAGSFGDDLIYGQMGRDTLLGGDGNDILVGGGGNDTIIGGTGADQVNGNGGTDVLAGGIGGSIVGDPGDFILGSPDEIDELFVFFADWIV